MVYETPQPTGDADYLSYVQGLDNLWRGLNPDGSYDSLRTTCLAHVDFLCPECYTYLGTTPEEWAGNANWRLAENQRLAAPGVSNPALPIYPFLSMYYIDITNQVNTTLLPPALWKFELATVRQFAPGVVIWGGEQTPWPGADGSWVAEAQDFMAETPVAPRSRPTVHQSRRHEPVLDE